MKGEAYAHKLMEAGVKVVATRYLGTIHAFVFLNAIADTPDARAAIAHADDTLRNIFPKSSLIGKDLKSRSSGINRKGSSRPQKNANFRSAPNAILNLWLSSSYQRLETKRSSSELKIGVVDELRCAWRG